MAHLFQPCDLHPVTLQAKWKKWTETQKGFSGTLEIQSRSISWSSARLVLRERPNEKHFTVEFEVLVMAHCTVFYWPRLDFFFPFSTFHGWISYYIFNFSHFKEQFSYIQTWATIMVQHYKIKWVYLEIHYWNDFDEGGGTQDIWLCTPRLTVLRRRVLCAILLIRSCRQTEKKRFYPTSHLICVVSHWESHSVFLISTALED